MPYPNKPWSNNQEYEIFPGQLYRYNLSSSTWVRLPSIVTDNELEANNAELDSDFRVLISLIDGGNF